MLRGKGEIKKRGRAGAEPEELFVAGEMCSPSTKDSPDDEWDSVRPVKCLVTVGAEGCAASVPVSYGRSLLMS